MSRRWQARAVILDALRDARALLFPVDCAGCGAHDRVLCPECLDHLAPSISRHATPGGREVHSALRYEGVVRSALLSFKEEGRTTLARALGAPLAAAVEVARGGGQTTVVPVPTSRRSYRRRGFDPVRVLLRATHIPHLAALKSRPGARAQKSLGLSERAHNVLGTLAPRYRLEGYEVVLVDDVVTSGATLEEAARAVESAGGRVVGAATVAFTPRLWGTRDIG